MYRRTDEWYRSRQLIKKKCHLPPRETRHTHSLPLTVIFSLSGSMEITSFWWTILYGRVESGTASFLPPFGIVLSRNEQDPRPSDPQFWNQKKKKKKKKKKKMILNSRFWEVVHFKKKVEFALCRQMNNHFLSDSKGRRLSLFACLFDCLFVCVFVCVCLWC